MCAHLSKYFHKIDKKYFNKKHNFGNIDYFRIVSKQARTIRVSKATKRHCAGTVQSQRGRV